MYKKSILIPKRVVGNSEGEGGLKKAKLLKYETMLEFPEGCGFLIEKKKDTWGMDTYIFWSNTLTLRQLFKFKWT